MPREDRLVTEEPLEIRVRVGALAPRRAWVTMRTPGHDFELAAGWLVHEGLATPDTLAQVAYCTDDDLDPEQEFNVVTVTVTGSAAVPHRHVAASAGSSACGVCGKDSVADALEVRSATPWSGERPAADVVRRLPEALRERQELFARTGGVHAAGLATADGTLLVVREDVGRHNAVDKVVGARVLAGEPAAAACLVLSGRVGFELVQKAAASGIGSIVAVGAPTSLAARLAREAGIELWGFTSASRAVNYC
ncbi:formate dehydrogenase accessory sulfurtransferase FdhD [Nocardioides sp. G10]|uniref:Formate dehydrogenase accessory sulfurtransferase FdhD n=1 Tax=Nocardioides baculatus TaxID=2801337 RepID=A0ABS1L950_9ACTN|nr:formate dehydrogenase accessory sulfurtransferase FdhD [Nocardioides baculatus]